MYDKYIILEIQIINSNPATLVHTAPTYNEAMSKYHSVLASAAISQTEKHSAVLLTVDGNVLANESYNHQIMVIGGEM